MHFSWAIRRMMEALKGELERKGGQGSGDTSGEEAREPSQPGGDGAGQVGNLDDFDNREVVQVPQALLDEIAEAIAHELEDRSKSAAEVLAEDPRNVSASARKADDDPERAGQITSQVMSQVQELREVCGIESVITFMDAEPTAPRQDNAAPLELFGTKVMPAFQIAKPSAIISWPET